MPPPPLTLNTAQAVATGSITHTNPPLADVSPRSATPQTGYVPMSNRLSSFLTTRKSTPNLLANVIRPISTSAATNSPNIDLQPPLPPTPSERTLSAALEKERLARQRAESSLNDASGELEELTVKLFEQANEMVAAERKARAKLEERVAVLERRDGEKRKRLERLEGAMGRIDRVRGLLSMGEEGVKL